MGEKSNQMLFVKIEEYKEVLDTLNAIKRKIGEAKSVLTKLEDVKNGEDSELNRWRSEIEEIEAKVAFIDHTMLDSGM